MRWLIFLCCLVACGGPNMTAIKAARYDVDRATVLELAREAVAAKRAIASEDATTIRTQPEDVEVYGAKGQRENYRAAFMISVEGNGPWQISVLGLIEGEPPQPTPDFLEPACDRIRADIHARLKQYAR